MDGPGAPAAHRAPGTATWTAHVLAHNRDPGTHATRARRRARALPDLPGRPERRRALVGAGTLTCPDSVADLVYALCGYGRGHASRAHAVAEVLRARGHRVTFATGGPAADAFEAAGERIYHVPALRQVVVGNRVQYAATARVNWPHARFSLDTIADAARWLRERGAPLVVADHEPFVSRAAARLGVPVVSLSHQAILTHARPRVPLRLAPTAWGTRWGVAVLAPRRPAAVVVPTFFFPPARGGATLVGPTLRSDVLDLRPAPGERVLVYLNEGAGMDGTLAALGRVDAAFDVYGVDDATVAPPNVTLHAPDRTAFLSCLATARAVIATAGFTLLSEALHVGVPVLALPNRGFFEQTVNAIHLVRQDRGEAVVGRTARASDVSGFLGRADRYRRPAATRAEGEAGREACADVVDAVLASPTSRFAAQASPNPVRADRALAAA